MTGRSGAGGRMERRSGFEAPRERAVFWNPVVQPDARNRANTPIIPASRDLNRSILHPRRATLPGPLGLHLLLCLFCLLALRATTYPGERDRQRIGRRGGGNSARPLVWRKPGTGERDFVI